MKVRQFLEVADNYKGCIIYDIIDDDPTAFDPDLSKIIFMVPDVVRYCDMPEEIKRATVQLWTVDKNTISIWIRL